MQTNQMVAAGILSQIAVGTSPVLLGLACTPSTPASLVVNVGPGAIVSPQVVDATTFGSLAVNSSALNKIGINLNSIPLTLSAPATAGFSTTYLIEGSFSEVDGNAVASGYYNPANPSIPYVGPGGSGAAQNTTRTQSCSIQLKAGVPAAAGTQVTPSVDVGWIPLYTVVINNGQTQITAAQITQAGSAPFLTANLTNVRTQLQGNLNLYVSSAANASDTLNSGLTILSPMRTLQGAYNYLVNNYDTNGFGVTINAANGSYASVLCARPVTGGGVIAFVGNATTPASCIVAGVGAHAFCATNGATISVSGFTTTATGTLPTAGAGLNTSANGQITIVGPMIFGSCTGAHITSQGTGLIQANSIAYTITGPSAGHFIAADGLVNIVSCTISIPTAVVFSTAFCVSALIGLMRIVGSTFSGAGVAACTGPRYSSTTAGLINTAGGGANYFPGSTAGVTATGGQYL